MESQEDAKFTRTAKDASGGAPRIERVGSTGQDQVASNIPLGSPCRSCCK